MTLKIEFVSDIKGFEKVQKNLEDNQKALNANAEALKRMNDEQAKMASGAFDFKGLTSLRDATKSIQELGKSFDSIMGRSAGTNGVLNFFSGFRKELNELNKEDGLKVLDTMNKQMDTLKGNVSTGTEALKRLRKDLSGLSDSDPPFVREFKEKQYKETAEGVQTSQKLINELTIQNMLRKPIMQFGQTQLPGGSGGAMGFLDGGTNLMRAGKIAGATMAAVPVAGMAASWALNAEYSDQRGKNEYYNQNMSRLDEARGGSISRNFMDNQGIGKESRFKQRLEGGDGFWFNKIGDSIGEDIAIKVKAMANGVAGFMRGKMPSAESLATGVMESGKELDSSRNDSVNRATNVARSIVTSQGFSSMEVGNGYDYARKLNRTMAKQGLTMDEASHALHQGKMWGVTDYAASSGLALSSGETGISDRARGEIMRRQSYGQVGKGGAYNGYGRILSVAGASGIDLSNSAYRESISDVVAQRTMNIAGQVDAGSVTQPFQQALTAMEKGGVKLNDQERISSASNMQSTVAGRFSQAGSMESMGLENALLELGVTNPVDRTSIAQLVGSNQFDRAARLAQSLTNKPMDQVRKALNGAKTMADDLRKSVTGQTKEGEAAYAKVGLSRDGYTRTGNITSGESIAGQGAVADSLQPFNEPSKGGASTPLFKKTTAREVATKEVTMNDQLLTMTSQLMTTAGDEGTKVAKIFTDYLVKFRTEIEGQFREVRDEMTDKRFSEMPMTQNIVNYQQQFGRPFTGTKNLGVKKAGEQ